ncbi:MAG: hypothetical protein IKJ11_03700 [Clostridia bacterium]|nr:hypothetical protein [Clostridia bacterium]
MKRLFAMLMLCLLLPAFAFAFDLSAYEIDDAAGTATDLAASHIEDRFSLEGHPCRLFSSGGVYSGGKGILVPFDDLPTISPPALTFQ